MAYQKWNHLYTILNLIDRSVLTYTDWMNISANPNISMNMIDAHPDWPWDYHAGVSRNINLTWKFVEGHADNYWDYKYIFEFNADVTWNDVSDNDNDHYPPKHDINLASAVHFIKNPNMTLELYKKVFKDYNAHHLKNIDNVAQIRHKHYILRNANVDFAVLMHKIGKFYRKVVAYVRRNSAVFELIHREINFTSGQWNNGTVRGEFANYAEIMSDNAHIIAFLHEIHGHDLVLFYTQRPMLPTFSGRSVDVRTFLNMIKNFKKCISANPNVVYSAIKDDLYQWDWAILASNHKALTIVESIEILKKFGANVDAEKDAFSSNMYMSSVIMEKHFNIYKSRGGFMIWNDHYITIDVDAEVYLTWPAIIQNGDYLALARNHFRKDRVYLHQVVVRRCFARWRGKVMAKHVAETLKNRAVYECCVHELKMRIRDVSAQMLVC